MIVACPNCLTRFRLDPKRLPLPRPMLKCSRCQYVFDGPWGSTKTPREQTPPAPSPQEEPLSFSFDQDDEWSDEVIQPRRVTEEQFSLRLEEPAGSDKPTRPKPARQPAPHESGALSWEEPGDEKEDAPMTARVSLLPLFIFLVLVVSTYALLAGTLYTNPEWAERLLQRVPLFGSALGGQLLTDQVALVDVRGTYQRSKEGRNFLLITGQAVNNAPVPLMQVQVSAKLLDENGAVLDDKSAFCGAPISASVLRDLSLHVLERLPPLRPTNRFLIEPGERSPFVIVFTDVPPRVSTLTAEVAAAQRQA
ncbi:MAG: hypothetical protein A3J75_00370 [Acidobacteria bacterium RBG_16_68_9]|nr:MAG: hypothetical protein A3J75_00370 [Acidobacteria bacterium RBG_16_68_9]